MTYGVPSTAFIAVDDFDSYATLAAHLRRVVASRALYMSYFAYRRTHAYTSRSSRAHAICCLCRMAYGRYHGHIPRTSYERIERVFSVDTCRDGFAFNTSETRAE